MTGAPLQKDPAAGPTVSPCPPALIALGQRLAEASGAVIRHYWRTRVPVDIKPDETPVTMADRKAEEEIRAILAEERPDDGILGEEQGSAGLDSEYVWCIDPIDGTKSFMTGRPLFGTLIGLFRGGVPILGILDQPVLEERWVGAVGHPTLFEGDAARVRPCPAVAQAVLTATTPDMFGPGERDAFARLSKASRYTVYGSDCYGYGLLAGGFLDLVVEAGLNTWDWAALVPVVEGAGGLMTDWQGRPLRLGSSGQVIAAGDARTHREALTLLAG